MLDSEMKLETSHHNYLIEDFTFLKSIFHFLWLSIGGVIEGKTTENETNSKRIKALFNEKCTLLCNEENNHFIMRFKK